MKKIKFTFVLFFFTAFLFQSCTGDINDLEDPRDAVVKKFRVTEKNLSDDTERSYDDQVVKDANEKTAVIFKNFHDENLEIKGTLAGSTITIKQQTKDGVTVKGSGTISSNLKEIKFNYTVDDGTTKDPVAFSADYGEPQVAKKVENKLAK